ncbi:hypothetical protein ACFL3D_05210 [Candidatus Omnitrophota bacterium]
MHRNCISILILFIFFVTAFACPYSFSHEEEVESVQPSSSQYDDITWHDINKKRKEREKNFFTKIYHYLFNTETETTYQGDEVTVIKTAGNVNFGNNDSPVQIVQVSSDN